MHLLLQRRCEGELGDLKGWLDVQLDRALTQADYQTWEAEAAAVIRAPALAAWFDATRIVQAWNEVALEGGDSILDRLVDDGQTLWVLDYKSTRGASDAALRDRYRAQLHRYRHAVQRAWPGRRVRSVVVLTDVQRWLEMDD